MMLKKDNLSHVIWDWNGTLLNDVSLCVATTNILLERRQLDLVSRELYLNKFSFPAINFYKIVGFEFEDHEYGAIAEEWISEYKKVFPASVELHQAVVRTLKQIEHLHVKQSILSACEKSLLDHSVDTYELTDFFHHVFGVDNNHAHGKVHLAHDGIANGHIEASESVLIGDTFHDYEVATEAGIHAILIANGHQHKSVLEKAPCPVLDNIEQIPGFLKENFNIITGK